MEFTTNLISAIKSNNEIILIENVKESEYLTSESEKFDINIKYTYKLDDDNNYYFYSAEKIS